jgi:hypothetical protein
MPKSITFGIARRHAAHLLIALREVMVDCWMSTRNVEHKKPHRIGLTRIRAAVHRG